MPYRPKFSPQPVSWWTLYRERSAFMAEAEKQQPRMSAECDPRIILNHVRAETTRAQDSWRKPKLARFLPDYAETAQDAA